MNHKKFSHHHIISIFFTTTSLSEFFEDSQNVQPVKRNFLSSFFENFMNYTKQEKTTSIFF